MFNWLNKKSIGIDISDRSIEVLELSQKKDLLAYGRIVLEEDIIRNGQILKKETLAAKLKEVLRSAKPNPLYPYPTGYGLKTVISLPEPKVLIHFFDLCLVDGESSDRQLANLIRAEAEKVVPVNLDSLYWDYLEVPNSGGFKPRGTVSDKNALKPVKDASSGARAQVCKSVLFVAAPKELVNEYLEVLKMTGLQPVILDIESAAQGRILLKSLPKSNASLVLDLGGRTTNISIFNKYGALTLSVSVGVGGNHLNKLIAEELKISDSEVENLKRKFGFDDLKSGNQILSILKTGFKKIIKELQSAVFHYENTYKERVESIILTGGSSLIPKVDEYVGLNIKRKVSVGNPLEAIRNAELFKRENIPPVLFSTAMGLALRGITDPSRGINLLKTADGQRGKNTASLITEKFLKFWLKIKKPRKEVLVVIFVIAAFTVLGIIVNQYIFRAKVGVVPSGPEFKNEGEKAEVGEEKEKNGTVTIPPPSLSNTVKIDQAPEKKILIKDTPTGWLNVREGPGTGYKILTKVYPAQRYTFLEEKDDWLKINVDGKIEGWVTSQYAQKIEDGRE